MKIFLNLLAELDQTTSTNDKVDAIARYFSKLETDGAKDAIWGLFFLSGKRFKRLISSNKLREWCQEEVAIPDWLFKECYARVGDTAEVISLLFKGEENVLETSSLSHWIEEFILPMRSMSEEEKRQRVVANWKRQTPFERLITNKILAGSFRIGVSSILAIKGLAQAFSLTTPEISMKLMGEWQPTETFFRYLISKDKDEKGPENRQLMPYPFFLAPPLEGDLAQLGDPADWLAEWKWDGIRAQIVSMAGEKAIWSRGNELITESFPDLCRDSLPTGSFRLDGEILCFENGKPRPFADLQKRISRKKVSASIQKQYPVVFMIYDFLEWEGQDLRLLPFVERRQKILDHPELFADPAFKLSPLFPLASWEEALKLREEAYQNGTEGLMLKRKDSTYGTGRKRGSWWKYKVESMTIDAVMIYAQPGSGYRSGLYTDYTFAVWDQGELVPIAKAYSGLKQEEIKEVDKWIRKETIEKFGPVRKVTPAQVFEIAFENIQVSNRHKSGLALRFPRIKRWRKDKTAEMADTLDNVRQMLQSRS